MIFKMLTLTVAVLLLNMTLLASSPDKLTKDAKLANKVRTNIAKLGTGPDAKVEVKLKDGAKLKGYVASVNETEFVVADAKTGAETPVAFPQVKQVKGHNWQKGVVIGLGVLAAIILIVVIGAKSSD